MSANEGQPLDLAGRGSPGNLAKRTFGGMVGMEAQVEKVRGRIRGGDVMTAIVGHYLFDLSRCTDKQGNFDICAKSSNHVIERKIPTVGFDTSICS